MYAKLNPISLINKGSDWNLHIRYVLFTMTSNIPLAFILLKQNLEREVPTYENWYHLFYWDNTCINWCNIVRKFTNVNSRNILSWWHLILKWYHWLFIPVIQRGWRNPTSESCTSLTKCFKKHVPFIKFFVPSNKYFLCKNILFIFWPLNLLFLWFFKRNFLNYWHKISEISFKFSSFVLNFQKTNSASRQSAYISSLNVFHIASVYK